jgi:amino acid permease
MATPAVATVPEDILVPAFDSPQRKSPVVVATFNLSATIIGGGVLSLPYAFSKTGLVLGTVLMMIAAIITERSLYLLCLCARLTGATSYGEVGEAAFGPWMEYMISFVLGIFLIFVIIAYMVLAQDIWTSVLKIAFSMEDPPNKDFVLLVIVVMISPFLMQETLHALRFNCYVGFSSVSILCLALVHHAWTTTLAASESPATADNNLVLWSTRLEDILIAFPIITLSFLSIFNVLPIQNALLRPTRTRVLMAIDGAMGSCFVLTLVFGAAGYIYAASQTDGNILNNCHSESDPFLFLGQLGCGVTVVLAMPMMLLPCRASLLEVIDALINGPHKTPVEKEAEQESQPLHKHHSSDYESISGASEEVCLLEEGAKVPISDNTVVHYTSTVLIVMTCFVIAINVPGVAVVWSIIGCFMAYLLSFILPSACYLEIQQRYPGHALQSRAWVWFSWILLIGSIVASIACTWQTITGLIVKK